MEVHVLPPTSRVPGPAYTLRYTGGNTPAMDKLLFLSHRVTDALRRSEQYLNDSSLFSAIENDDGVGFENGQVFGSNDKSIDMAVLEDDDEL